MWPFRKRSAPALQTDADPKPQLAATSGDKSSGNGRPPKSVLQPSTRVYRTWTPKQIKSVERMADSGSMAMLADLCDQIGADDRISKAYDTVVGGLLGLPLSFEPSGDGRRRGRAVKALEAGEDWWRAFPESELQQFLGNGLLAGISFAQLKWTQHQGRLIPLLEPWWLGHFRYDWGDRAWYATVEGGLEVEVTPGDGRWVVFAPYGSNRPWARGKWRGLSRLWLLKSYAISDWGRHSGAGAVFAGVPNKESQHAPESNRQSRAELASDIYDLAQDGGVIVLPNGFDLKMIEIAANTERIYKAQIDFVNTSVDIAIQGQNLTSEVSGGSRAAATVHAKVETRVIRSVAVVASTTLHDQALEPWAGFNFGDRLIAPWPTWNTQPPEDVKTQAEGQEVFGKAIDAVQKAGYDVENVDELAEKHGLKLRKVDKPKEPVSGKVDDDEPDDKDDDAEARAARSGRPMQRGGFATQLASGAPASENPGMVAGQLYADALVESAAAAANEALEPTIADIGLAIDECTSLEDLRDRLQALAPKLDATQLNELVFRAMLLGEMAGRRAVTQDA